MTKYCPTFSTQPVASTLASETLEPASDTESEGGGLSGLDNRALLVGVSRSGHESPMGLEFRDRLFISDFCVLSSSESGLSDLVLGSDGALMGSDCLLLL